MVDTVGKEDVLQFIILNWSIDPGKRGLGIGCVWGTREREGLQAYRFSVIEEFALLGIGWACEECVVDVGRDRDLADVDLHGAQQTMFNLIQRVSN